ncbi:MAG: SRPBCC family protein [Acidimicrobiales bacterium]
MSHTVSVSRDIAASPEVLWAMVTDVTRTGEWSPENQGGAWLGTATAAVPGARFKARNRNGSKSWSTVSRVLDATPGRRFAFRVMAGPIKVADWSYTFEPTADGCRVTESFTDLRPGWFRPIAKIATGVADRDTHNRAGMEQTLERFAAAAERHS